MKNEEKIFKKILFGSCCAIICHTSPIIINPERANRPSDLLLEFFACLWYFIFTEY
jgi:hypothetical protein